MSVTSFASARRLINPRLPASGGCSYQPCTCPRYRSAGVFIAQISRYLLDLFIDANQLKLK
jgi:hypothetical protein